MRTESYAVPSNDGVFFEIIQLVCNPRKPTSEEKRLIQALVKGSDLSLMDNWESTLLVETMNDGGMGSLLLFPFGVVPEPRTLGGVAGKIEFKDKDGIDVLVSLNLDKDGSLFEIDSWKVDFSPLIELPKDI